MSSQLTSLIHWFSLPSFTHTYEYTELTLRIGLILSLILDVLFYAFFASTSAVCTLPNLALRLPTILGTPTSSSPASPNPTQCLNATQAAQKALENAVLLSDNLSMEYLNRQCTQELHVRWSRYSLTTAIYIVVTMVLLRASFVLIGRMHKIVHRISKAEDVLPLPLMKSYTSSMDVLADRFLKVKLASGAVLLLLSIVEVVLVFDEALDTRQWLDSFTCTETKSWLEASGFPPITFECVTTLSFFTTFFRIVAAVSRFIVLILIAHSVRSLISYKRKRVWTQIGLDKDAHPQDEGGFKNTIRSALGELTKSSAPSIPVQDCEAGASGLDHQDYDARRGERDGGGGGEERTRDLHTEEDLAARLGLCSTCGCIPLNNLGDEESMDARRELFRLGLISALSFIRRKFSQSGAPPHEQTLAEFIDGAIQMSADGMFISTTIESALNVGTAAMEDRVGILGPDDKDKYEGGGDDNDHNDDNDDTSTTHLDSARTHSPIHTPVLPQSPDYFVDSSLNSMESMNSMESLDDHIDDHIELHNLNNSLSHRRRRRNHRPPNNPTPPPAPEQVDYATLPQHPKDATTTTTTTTTTSPSSRRNPSSTSDRTCLVQ